MDSYDKWIGKSVRKKKKPFKSKKLINVVKGIVDHPFLEGQKAFTFFDDDSMVACDRCFLVSK
ncbi:MAG: hypothetical protein KDH96_00655 [Candidatus Riesia sp.]|nr:hypothetical protein [Candidatus Riesia sp.]